jgi:hypothetical protein
LWLRANPLVDISALVDLEALHTLQVGYTGITRIDALVANEGLGDGDEVGVTNSSLICDATIQEHVQALIERGVILTHDCAF